MDNNGRDQRSSFSNSDSGIGLHRRQDDADEEDRGGHERQSKRRRKPPRVRSRASRACDRCKSRKIRCTGKYPCHICTRAGLDCQYLAEYRRGRLPSIEMESDDQASPGDPEAGPEMVEPPTPGDPAEHLQHHPDPEGLMPPGIALPVGGGRGDASGRGISANQSSRNSPEPAQTDRQGHYVGPASGASFLLRIQRKLQQQQPAPLSSDMSIFTFGDLPLPECDPRFLILPPRSEAESMVARYYEYASATHRYTHRPTVETWLHELYETKGTMRDQTTARSRTALVFMVFACAENYPKFRAGKVDPASSARFFAAAEDQLSAEKGAIRLTSVQARLMQCIYLLSHSRMNHCWSLFGTTAHLMMALGIHRKSRVDIGGRPDYIDLECRRRTFWCAYNLDTYLSAALGRPRTFHDEDVDQDLPLCVDDYRLVVDQSPAVPTTNLRSSVMLGAVAHIRLSRIVAKILRDLYSIRPPSTENQFKLAAVYAKEIEAWRISVAYLVETDQVDPSLFQPIFLRQRNVLSLACWHAQILVHRPFLLNNFASLANLGSTSNRRAKSRGDERIDHVQRCYEAAMNIVDKFNDLHSNGQLYNTFWFSHYFAFSAVVMLYLFAIQHRHSQPETFLAAFHAATKCQGLISSLAIPGSLAERYGVVLQELRLELLRHNSHLLALALEQRDQDPTNSTVLDGDAAILGQFDASGLLALHQAGLHMGPEDAEAANQLGLGEAGLALQHGDSPGSSVAQMTGWGQFDSLVTGGMGRLDSFIGDGNLDNWGLPLGGGLGA